MAKAYNNMDILNSIMDFLDPDPKTMINTVLDDVNATADILENISNYVEGLFQAFVMLGCALAIVYFVIDLMNTAATTELTVDKVVKGFLKLVVAFLLVKNGYVFLIQAANLGDLMAQAIVIEEVSSSNGILDAIYTTIWNTFILLACFLPGIIISALVFLSSKIVLYSRLVEVGINIILSPLALADLPTGGIKSHAITFIKKFLALSLQSLIIVLILAIFSEIGATSTSMTQGLTSLCRALEIDPGEFIATLGAGGLVAFVSGFATGTVAAAPLLLAGAYTAITYAAQGFIMISFLFKSKQLANDIMGV